VLAGGGVLIEVSPASLDTMTMPILGVLGLGGGEILIILACFMLLACGLVAAILAAVVIIRVTQRKSASRPAPTIPPPQVS
jgi:hypothetical protein